MSLKISVYLKPRYSLEKSESNKLFLKRPVRKLPNGNLGVIYRGKPFTLFKGNYIDQHFPEEFNKEDCPVLDEASALARIKELPSLQDPAEAQALSEISPVFKDWSEEEGVTMLSFEEDWNLDCRKYYAYIVFKEDETFTSLARELLTNPSFYLLHENAPWPGSTAYRGENNQMVEDIYNKSSSYADSPHLSFEDRYGDLDFEFRQSTQSASDGVQYDYWFRFDPNIDQDLLRDMAEEVFSICSVAKKHGLEWFSVEKLQEDQENLTSSLTDNSEELEATKNELELALSSNKKLSSTIEILESRLEKINEETFLEEVIDLEDEKQKLSEEIENLKKSEKNLKNKLKVTEEDNRKLKEKLDNENRQLLKIGFPEVYFLEKRTLKSLSDSYLKREPVFRNVRDILTNQTNFKRVQGTKEWLEVDKKISNGTDNQGRLYYCKIKDPKYSFSMLISHKANQKSDLAYLSQNDPPTFSEL